MEDPSVNAIDNPAQLCADATIHSTPFKWGRCIISTVELEDTGWRRYTPYVDLKNTCKAVAKRHSKGILILAQEAIVQERNGEDQPVSGVRKVRKKKAKKKKKLNNKEGAGCTPELQPLTEGGDVSKEAAAMLFSSAPWQQCYDEPTGYYYYFNEATQETQWEPPAEDFVPLPLYPDPSFQSAVVTPQEEGDTMDSERFFREVLYEESKRGMAAITDLLRTSSASPAAIRALIAAARSLFDRAASRPVKGSSTKAVPAGQASVPEASSCEALLSEAGGAMPNGEGRVASRSGASLGGEEVARERGVEISPGRAVIEDVEQAGSAVPLRARSTGFMSAIPLPQGEHIRFKDEEGDKAEQLAKSSAGECSELPYAARAGEQGADSGGNEVLLVRSSGLEQSIPLPAGVHLQHKAEHDQGEQFPAGGGSIDWVPVHDSLSVDGAEEAADMKMSPSGQAMDAVLEDIVQHTLDLHDIAAVHDAAPNTMQLGQEAAAVAIQPSDLQPNEQAAGQTESIAAAALLGNALQSDEHETEASQGAAPLATELTHVRQELMQRFGGPGLFQRLKAANLSKYWMQRYSLWSRFDEGVLMDEEGWYSATPEVLARHHAGRLACDVAVDAFCGVGGNAVQLAATCRRVIAVDISMERLQLAQHNAAVYGVADRIDFVCADFLKLAPHLQADAVFLSPPWGGPSYSVGSRGGSSFDVEHGFGSLGIGFEELLSIAQSALVKPASCKDDSASSKCQSTIGVACFLPRNSSLKQLSAAVPAGSLCEVERNFLNDKLKSVTVYCGQLANVA